MEASALRAPSLTAAPLGVPLLRLRSDDQLLSLFRAGHEDAFGVIHDRYRQRLFAYVRQMLSPSSRQDAEDVLQDVFIRAYRALRADEREVNLRAWLYRVAHNRCIDHLRRPVPPAAEIFEMSRKPLHDPIEEAQRREDLARLVEDVARLPEQQRSALLMRELDGMAYAELALALDVSVPAVKSLLVRARVGLVDAAEARDADCCDIRDDLLSSYDRGVKASGRARRHMRTCDGCREYRVALRGMRRSFAALAPVSPGVLALTANLLGLGGGGAAAGGSAAVGGGAAASTGVAATAAGGTLATATACKVAAVVCTAALTAGGAAEVNNLRAVHHDRPARPVSRTVPTGPAAPAPLTERPVLQRALALPASPAVTPADRPARRHGRSTAPAPRAKADPKAAAPAGDPDAKPGDAETAGGEGVAGTGEAAAGTQTDGQDDIGAGSGEAAPSTETTPTSDVAGQPDAPTGTSAPSGTQASTAPPPAGAASVPPPH